MKCYELLRLLGEGASSVVYLAQHKETGQLVVIKRFFHSIVHDHWKREIAILSKLQHPQIPKYIETFREKIEGRTLPHLVMEFIEGQDLSQYIQTNSLDLTKISRLLGDILEILHYTHTLIPAVIHRDIKPANIIIREDRIVALIDFGVATEDQHLTLGHSIMRGTLGYQAPEQIIGNPTVKSDIYALGVLCVHLITGKQPHKLMNNGYTIEWREICSQSSFFSNHKNADWWMWLEGVLEVDEQKRFDVEKAQLLLPTIFLKEAKRDVSLNNPFVQKLNQIKTEKQKVESLEQEKIQKENDKRLKEEERRQRKQFLLRKAKQEYCDEIEVSWIEMVHSIEQGIISQTEGLQLFCENYQHKRFVEIEGEILEVEHIVLSLLEWLLKPKNKEKNHFYDVLNWFFSFQSKKTNPTPEFNFQDYWNFVHKIFDSERILEEYAQVRKAYIKSQLELELMNPFEKLWMKTGEEKEKQCKELEQLLLLKRNMVNDILQKMKPFFFFTEEFSKYQSLFFEEPLHQENQKWEIDILQEYTGLQRGEGESLEEFREFALLQYQEQFSTKMWIGIIGVFAVLSMLYLVF